MLINKKIMPNSTECLDKMNDKSNMDLFYLHENHQWKTTISFLSRIQVV